EAAFWQPDRRLQTVDRQKNRLPLVSSLGGRWTAVGGPGRQTLYQIEYVSVSKTVLANTA
ncbi:MAG: hypothetical protein KDI62_20515, partial [Anaerolineae bacterium]|nr:hypothetical protein [Anaerolineae bacterium]